jgi:hypothetical protein
MGEAYSGINSTKTHIRPKAEKLDEMAALCHFKGNSFGGKCVSPKNEWFIQYVLSSFFIPDVLTDLPGLSIHKEVLEDFPLQLDS